MVRLIYGRGKRRGNTNSPSRPWTNVAKHFATPTIKGCNLSLCTGHVDPRYLRPISAMTRWKYLLVRNSGAPFERSL